MNVCLQAISKMGGEVLFYWIQYTKWWRARYMYVHLHTHSSRQPISIINSCVFSSSQCLKLLNIQTVETSVSVLCISIHAYCWWISLFILLLLLWSLLFVVVVLVVWFWVRGFHSHHSRSSIKMHSICCINNSQSSFIFTMSCFVAKYRI